MDTQFSEEALEGKMDEITHMDGVIEDLELKISALQQTIKDMEMTHEVDMANAVWKEREACAEIADSWGDTCKKIGQTYQEDVCRDVSSVIRSRND